MHVVYVITVLEMPYASVGLWWREGALPVELNSVTVKFVIVKLVTFYAFI